MSDREEQKALLNNEIDRVAQMSTTYGQLVVRYGILLNAGALLAIPAFMEASIVQPGGLSVWSVGPFVAGLILAIFGASLAHFQAFFASVKLQKMQVYLMEAGPEPKPFGGGTIALMVKTYLVSISAHVLFAMGSVNLVAVVSEGAK